MEYEEEDFLPLSGIQHFAFCRRQWALIHIEQQWEENFLTVEGELQHENVHDRDFTETRQGILTVRGMPVHSVFLGISGACDAVEFRRDDKNTENSISLTGRNGKCRNGKYLVVPIEYKHGKPKENDADILQLTAQAMCLEEMLCCHIPVGFLYYHETRHRLEVALDDAVRKKTADIFAEMHHDYERRYTPRVRRTKACNACALKNRCLPALGKAPSASEYIQKRIAENNGTEDFPDSPHPSAISTDTTGKIGKIGKKEEKNP